MSGVSEEQIISDSVLCCESEIAKTVTMFSALQNISLKVETAMHLSNERLARLQNRRLDLLSGDSSDEATMQLVQQLHLSKLDLGVKKANCRSDSTA